MTSESEAITVNFQTPFYNRDTSAPPVYTIYSKDGCGNCVELKTFFQRHGITHHVVECDEYLRQDRTGFLAFIHRLANRNNIRTFPMVFCGQTEFVGGKTEAMLHAADLGLTEELEAPC